MMTAIGVDGKKNGIWPIALYKVQQESKCTWYDFLTKLDEVLRLDNDEGFCFMSDGENGWMRPWRQCYFEESMDCVA